MQKKPKKSGSKGKSQKEKVYVIDTNIVINDSKIVDKLKGKVFVPTTVLSELDKHKQGHSEKARSIREFARFLEKNQTRVHFHDSEFYEGTNDQKIIASGVSLSAKYDVTIVTNDILMGILARAKSLKVERHEVSGSTADVLYKGVVVGEEAYKLKDNLNTKKDVNQYLVLHDGIYRSTANGLQKLPKDFSIWGLTHKNVEQRCALDALLDPNIKLVTLSGKAGTGKTLIALASALEAVLEQKSHKKIIVARPIVPMGNDLGYLPGSVEEKLSPWMQPIVDNLEFLMDGGNNKGQQALTELQSEGLLKMEALTYIRGRSIPNEFIIIDEAQNLTRHEVKTIISRAGEGTKIVLTGDIYQIDNPKVDSVSNGLAYVIDKFRDQKIASHIHFSKCERSELAELASELL